MLCIVMKKTWSFYNIWDLTIPFTLFSPVCGSAGSGGHSEVESHGDWQWQLRERGGGGQPQRGWRVRQRRGPTPSSAVDPAVGHPALRLQQPLLRQQQQLGQDQQPGVGKGPRFNEGFLPT